MPDSPKRSILKSFSWRLLATLTTAALVYATTGEWDLAVAIGSMEVVAKFILYYLHERAWQRWGTIEG